MIFSAFCVALLAGLGVGSGGLFVVFLTVAEGIPQLEAQGLNLYFFIFASAAALPFHLKVQHLHLRRLLILCLAGGVGCVCGALLAQNLSTGILRTVFAGVLILSGAISLFRKQESGTKARTR